MDLILNWVERIVTIYYTMPGMPITKVDKTARFYNTPSYVNAVRVYNLNSGTTGFIKDIEVCDSECTGFTSGLLNKINVVFMFLMMGIMFLL